MGAVANVVFPSGFIANEEEASLRHYYGAADTYVGLETGKLSEIIDLAKREIKKYFL